MMKKVLSRTYEVFNLQTQKWESKDMTEEQYQDLLSKMDQNTAELDAEYEIVTRVIAQKLGHMKIPKESMD
tara:strand:+ start:83 stop:295 length:213 start_codon:yes stop_codon:yes gene_type:complete